MDIPSNSKRRSYTAKFKLNAVQLAKKIGNRAAAREVCVDEKRIREWRNQETLLQKMPKTKRAQRRGPRAHWEELEKKLCAWITDQRANGRSVSSVLIRIKAKQIAKENDLKNFTSGTSWYSRFCRHNNLSIRASHVNRAPLPPSDRKLY